MKKYFFLFFILLNLSVWSQVTIQPTFFGQDDEITVIYDATQGTGQLSGVSPVYMHAGLITSSSTGPSDWQFVQGMWGTPDANVLMEDQGGNIHTKTYVISDFHSLPPGEIVECLAFVFRNADGSLEGKTSDGGDIFVCLGTGGYEVVFTNPAQSSILLGQNDPFNLEAAASSTSDLEIFINGNSVATSTSSTTISFNDNSASYGLGQHLVVVSANDGSNNSSDTLQMIVQGSPTVLNPPVNVEDGINYIDDNTVILQLHAPNKDFVYVLGDFTNWEYDIDYFMNKRADEPERWWVQIEDLVPGVEYRFQYDIEGTMRIPDVYSEKLLDPWNDQWIEDATYPDLTPYPVGQTSQIVSIFETGQIPYNWQNSNYTRPAKENLIIYELLVRDFLHAHDYNTLIDTLDYLQNLGINAIELMPINEFEGNSSWGYNASFYFAPDKYYGTEDKLKALIDECHGRGMAIIMDMTLNHSFGQNPMVRMYFDASAGQWGQPTSENPWFNEVAKHDFNVGYDFNHESIHTQSFVDSVLAYWVNEYQIDGYRMDLSKGFTQNNTLGNTAAWGNYDQSRIDLWNRIGTEIWNQNPETYMILEHFANNNEEVALANMGFMIWGNMNHEYNEASMGYNSNLNWGSYQARGWNNPNLVTYMESHDEERLMFKNIQYGNGSGSYQVTNPSTALERIELCANFFIPIPGPKMIWQFGELGYDFSINTCTDGITIDPECRTHEKPIKWGYFQQEDRKYLYKVYSALNKLKLNEPTFQTSDFNLDVSGMGKRIHLNHTDMNVTIIGNFDVVPINIIPGFQHTGTWYEYWSGQEIIENNLNNAFLLQPGEYRLYTDVQLELPDLNVGIEDNLNPEVLQAFIYPNPSKNTSTLNIHHLGGNLSVTVYDVSGKKLRSIYNGNALRGKVELQLNEGSNMTDGVYIVEIRTEDSIATIKWILGKP